MARFNATTDRFKTTNRAGGEAWDLTPEMQLYTRVCTSLLYPKYYESSTGEQIQVIRELISECSPDFIEKLAVYAREKMFLRTIPLVLVVEAAKQNKCDIRKMSRAVIQRADEITELLGAYASANQRTGTKKLNRLSNALKKGIGEAFNKFDEYQFGKYNRKGEYTFKDALRLCHPKPATPEKSRLFSKILNDDLETPYTWETRLSQAGQNGEDKVKVWEELIESGRIPYMALMRNFRNILEAGVSWEHLMMVGDVIGNESNVLRSKQLPFRFFSAYRALTGVPSRTGWLIPETKVPKMDDRKMVLVNSLEKAIRYSVNNIDFFSPEDKILLACDVSGSMKTPVSPRSQITQYDIGLLMAMLLQFKCQKVVTGVFGNTWKMVDLPNDNVLFNMTKIPKLSNIVGLATNGYKVLEWANNSEKQFDKICFFTDCQLYGGSLNDEWKKYKRKNPEARLYLFDLNGYGDTPIDWKDNDVTIISGWSNEIFRVLNMVEGGGKVLDSIHQMEL